jgi:threonine-phosphate decarboxylase
MTDTFDHGGTVFALARSLGIPPEELLDFSASINPLGPAPGVRDAVCSSFQRVLHYPDREAVELRGALADFHGVGAGNIVVANGSTELIYLLPRLLPGKKGLIVAPAFSEYARALERTGWEAEYLILSPADGFALSLEKLAARLAEDVDVLFLCNPANPTGSLLPLTLVERIYGLCRQARTFLVLDEAFMDFREEESAKRVISGDGGGIVLRSMTKFYAIPGLRLGYAIGAEDLIRNCADHLEPWSVNTPAQIAGIASLADAGYRERTVGYITAERNALAAGLGALPGLTPYPSAANFLLVELRNGMSAHQVRASLLQRHIIIRDCSNFVGLDGRFFRVAVRGRDENSRLLIDMEGIVRELAG